MRRSLTIVLITTALLGAGSAGAFHDPEGTLVADDLFSGNGWGAYRVRVPAGSKVLYDIEPTMLDARRTVAASWLMHADGSLAAAFITTGYSGATTERHVQGPEPVGVVMTGRDGGIWGNGGLGGGWQFNVAGEYVLVNVAASDGIVSSRLRLYTTDGVEVLAATTGTEAFVWAESDFTGTANVTVSESCLESWPLCGNAQALIGQQLEHTVGGAMFGIFEANGFDPVTVGSFQTPARTGTIIGSGAVVFSNEQPGTYRFRVEANAGGPLSGLTVWGAGVVMP